MVIQIFFFKETAGTGLESSCLLPCLLPTKPGVNGKKGFLYFLYFFNRMKFHTGIFSGLLNDMLVDLPPCAAGTTFVRAIQNLPKRRKLNFGMHRMSGYS